MSKIGRIVRGKVMILDNTLGWTDTFKSVNGKVLNWKVTEESFTRTMYSIDGLNITVYKETNFIKYSKESAKFKIVDDVKSIIKKVRKKKVKNERI